MSQNSKSSTTTAPLCLACSSSLPPRLWKRATTQQGAQSASGNDSELLFLTRCCGRPICPSCLTSNPRLARYNPCLACLGGVGALGTKKLPQGQHPVVASNVDGAVRDEDVFVVGDEDEEEDGFLEMDDGEAAKAPVTSPPSEDAGPPEFDVQVMSYAEPDKPDEPAQPTESNPGRYYIRPDDTLLGISLRLGVEVSIITKSLPHPLLFVTPPP